MVSNDLSECTALEVNSSPRQASSELALQVGMYEISLGLERTPVEEGQRWLELHPSGAVIVPEPVEPVSEPEPEPEPEPRREGEDTAGRFVQSDGAVWAAAAAEPAPGVQSFLCGFPGLV